jgi:hypothetical protein
VQAQPFMQWRPQQRSASGPCPSRAAGESRLQAAGWQWHKVGGGGRTGIQASWPWHGDAASFPISPRRPAAARARASGLDSRDWGRSSSTTHFRHRLELAVTDAGPRPILEQRTIPRPAAAASTAGSVAPPICTSEAPPDRCTVSSSRPIIHSTSAPPAKRPRMQLCSSDSRGCCGRPRCCRYGGVAATAMRWCMA